jgi:adenylyl- and sulfurtransferase ThiI
MRWLWLNIKEQARYVIFDPVIVIDNQVVGNWRRTIKTNAVDISYNLFGKLNKAQAKALEVAEKSTEIFIVRLLV